MTGKRPKSINSTASPRCSNYGMRRVPSVHSTMGGHKTEMNTFTIDNAEKASQNSEINVHGNNSSNALMT